VFDRVLTDAERHTSQGAPYPILAPIRRRAWSLAHKPDIPGLPCYAEQVVDQQFACWVMLHVQSNPLPICTRPRVLIKGKRT
jgi:Phage major capsid protein E